MQGYAGSKTLHQQNPTVLNWRCRPTQVDLCNGRKTVVVVAAAVVVVVVEAWGAKIPLKYHNFSKILKFGVVFTDTESPLCPLREALPCQYYHDRSISWQITRHNHPNLANFEIFGVGFSDPLLATDNGPLMSHILSPLVCENPQILFHFLIWYSQAHPNIRLYAEFRQDMFILSPLVCENPQILLHF